jgi:hypothetical protein
MSTISDPRRRDFLLKLFAIPVAAAVAIPLLTDDADAQQPFPRFPGKIGKRKGKGKGKGKAPGAGRGGKGTGKAKGAKGKNPDPTQDPPTGNQKQEE